MVNNRIFATFFPIVFLLQIFILCPSAMAADSTMFVFIHQFIFPLFIHPHLSVTKAFIENDIVPKVLEEGPTELAKVKFSDGHEAELGNLLTPQQTNVQPNVEWDSQKQNGGQIFYTVAMVDPDAPSRANPTNR
jgi:hypothetical protein